MIDKKISNKQIIIDDLLINYYFILSNKKSPKTLVFLHGWGVDSKLWFKIVPELINKNYSLYFLDLPGFGQSQIPNYDYSIDDYKKIVIEFIKKLDLKKITLVGHSFGGSISIKIASENPIFLEKLILVNASGIRYSSTPKKIKTFLAKIIKPLFSPSFMQPLRFKFYQLIGSEYLSIPAMSRIFKKVVSENLLPILSKINTSTLIISGDKDKITPVNLGRQMNKKIKNSELIILSAGHFSFLDQTQKFVKELINFSSL